MELFIGGSQQIIVPCGRNKVVFEVA